MTAWEGLNPPYSTIVADPPWPYEARPTQFQRNRGTSEFLPYSTMTLEEIGALDVGRLAAPGAHLYLWTTNAFLEDSFGVLRLWGFSPTTTVVWCKSRSGERPGGGPFAITTEFVIHARRPMWSPTRKVERAGRLIREARESAGWTQAEVHHRVRGGKKTGQVHNWENDLSLPSERDWAKLQALLPALRDVDRPSPPPPPPREPVERKCVDSTWWEWPTGAHSQKPAAFLDIVEQVSPGPYVELFARAPRLGWDSWGKGYESGAA